MVNTSGVAVQGVAAWGGQILVSQSLPDFGSPARPMTAGDASQTVPFPSAVYEVGPKF
jgi:hypothetical protein